MSGTPRRTADEILFDALHTPESQRASFLTEACGEDAALREEVASLLAAHGRAGRFLKIATQSEATGAECGSADPWIGREIGAYRIEAVIGRGGMGTVYQGQRSDDEYRKRVAIKLIRAGMATEDVLRRFRIERQVLAQLDHPNIARLIDGGATEDGLPYLVMDHVEGVPIDRFCRAHDLEFPDRLRLFRKVCAPVEYAHQHLVVHRDLKPGNVLITSDGEPKLLDFGIAKVLDPASAAGPEATRSAQRLLTPRYASPEHLCGQAVTTTSDVYSLGVILYELLTGLHPFEVDPNCLEDLRRVVTTQEPTRPSTAVLRRADGAGGHRSQSAAKQTSGLSAANRNKARLSRSLAGDLDNIILTALRREPTRRYATVAHFSDDVRRYLEGLPIAARADTFGYQFGKFVRRNAAMVGAAAILLIGLLAASIVSTGMYFRADAARQAAEQAESEAESARTRANRDLTRQVAVKVFLTQVLTDLKGVGDDSPPHTVLEALNQRVAGISAARVPLEPDIEASVHTAAGELYRWLGEPEEAVHEFETAIELYDEAGTDTRHLADALVFLGRLLLELDRADEATVYLARAIDVHARIESVARTVAVTRLWLAEALVADGRLDEADEQMAQVEPIESAFHREMAERTQAEVRRRREGGTP